MQDLIEAATFHKEHRGGSGGGGWYREFCFLRRRLEISRGNYPSVLCVENGFARILSQLKSRLSDEFIGGRKLFLEGSSTFLGTPDSRTLLYLPTPIKISQS